MTNKKSPQTPAPSILGFMSAPASGIYQDLDLADDFVEHILELNPQRCLLTDRSSLSDFAIFSDEEFDATWAAIERRYNIKVPSNKRSDRLVSILGYLRAHAKLGGKSAPALDDPIDLEELKSRPVHLNPTILQELTATMPEEQLRHIKLLAMGIKNPDEVWIQRDKVGDDASASTWFRTYIARFEIADPQGPTQMATVSRFHLQAYWELFDMKAITSEAAEIETTLSTRFRHGHQIFPL